jgi:hypothetical protein
MEVFMGLVCGGGLVGLFLLVSRFLAPDLWQQLDRGTRIAIAAGGLVVGALAFGLTRWLDADTVVEFVCDGRSFRFRRLGSAKIETRVLTDVVEVTRQNGRGPLRFRVTFRDGVQAVLWCDDLPNAAVAAEWLGSHSQGA